MRRDVRDALIHRLQVRGEPFKVAVELSLRRKNTLSNMFKAESFSRHWVPH